LEYGTGEYVTGYDLPRFSFCISPKSAYKSLPGKIHRMDNLLCQPEVLVEERQIERDQNIKQE